MSQQLSSTDGKHVAVKAMLSLTTVTPSLLLVQVFSLDSHRLAHYLDSQGRLAAIVEEGIAAALGMRSPTAVRLTNLL